jgi:hypothetical protein
MTCPNSCCQSGVLTTGNPCPTCRGAGSVETALVLGPIVHDVRELPADFYGPRFYVSWKRSVTNPRTGNVSELGGTRGAHFHTRAEAERALRRAEEDAQRSPASLRAEAEAIEHGCEFNMNEAASMSPEDQRENNRAITRSRDLNKLADVLDGRLV